MSGPNAPPRPSKPGQPAAKQNGTPAATRSIGVSRGVKAAAHKVVIYGPGGVGKSELASLLRLVNIDPLFLDVEDGSRFLDVARISPTPETWEEVRAVLHDAAMLEPFQAVVIDSATKLEELAVAWTLANVPHEKGHVVASIEAYGWGKGYTHVYETFLQVLGDLDAIARGGRHVILTAHDCTANVPNPAADDWIRYEPRLQAPPSGKGSIRHRLKEWTDHLLYIGFDVAVDGDGKAKGGGTRTIYPTEMPTHWAKSRTLSEQVPYRQGDPAIWRKMFGIE